MTWHKGKVTYKTATGQINEPKAVGKITYSEAFGKIQVNTKFGNSTYSEVKLPQLSLRFLDFVFTVDDFNLPRYLPPNTASLSDQLRWAMTSGKSDTVASGDSLVKALNRPLSDIARPSDIIVKSLTRYLTDGIIVTDSTDFVSMGINNHFTETAPAADSGRIIAETYVESGYVEIGYVGEVYDF